MARAKKIEKKEEEEFVRKSLHFLKRTELVNANKRELKCHRSIIPNGITYRTHHQTKTKKKSL